MPLRRTPLLAVVPLLLAALLGSGGPAPAALPAPAAAATGEDARWADTATATIHPGVQMFTAGAQCTANFVFTDRRARVYVGYAAHCAGRGEAADTDGCATRSLPLGAGVDFVTGADPVAAGEVVGHGVLAYSSWRTMRRIGTTDADACAGNDFALVRVDPADVASVNPSVPLWGGPAGLAEGGAPAGTVVYSWGQSSLRPTTLLSPKVGTSVGEIFGGWGWTVLTATPGIPGDSGSGFLDAGGAAVGTLSTLTLAPLAGSNGIGDLARELAFARKHSAIGGLRLVRGTEPFRAVPGL